MNWKYINKYFITPDLYPHESCSIDYKNIPWGKTVLIARWVSEFDCKYETAFWYCIKDDGFDINSIKAKRRYEINKGLKNYKTKIIKNPEEYKEELYSVYLDSLQGYKNPSVISKKDFFEYIKRLNENKYVVLFGVFSNSTGELCGYSDIYLRGRYLPISSLKTRVQCEKTGVNFALIYGIIMNFIDEITNGAYLCDGARNAVHQTQFQDFLIKYFGFRKAYCKLNVEYRGIFKHIINILYPFRNFLRQIPCVKYNLYPILKQEAWKRGEE